MTEYSLYSFYTYYLENKGGYSMSHVLIIGGSGMLKGTSIWLASKYDYVTVIGRSKKKMESLINQCNNIKPLYLDYHDTRNLKLEIEEQEKIDLPDEIKKLVEERIAARENKNWVESDRIRDILNERKYWRCCC